MCQQALTVAAVTRHMVTLGTCVGRLETHGILDNHKAPSSGVGVCAWDRSVQSAQLGSASGIFTSSVIRGRLFIHHLKLGIIIAANYWVVVSIK